MVKKIIKNKVPVIDSDKCIRCEKCIAICTNGAIIKTYNNACSKCIKYCISMKVPCNPNNLIFSYEKCDTCGKCISACSNNAIYWFNTNTLEFGLETE